MDLVDPTIVRLESLLLPSGCHFAADAREVINCWVSTNVQACPGSGKTTVLMAKLKILADQMPLADGRGICILSHTNVAIDEIKNRLAVDSLKILGYPNFAGTIQSFVDTFVVFPFWRSFVKVPLRVVSLTEYARCSWQLMQCGYQYSALKGFISHNYGDNTANESPINVIEKLSLDNDGCLLLSGKKMGGADSKSAQQFKALNQYLHKSEGLITYEDAYKCTSNILKRYGEQIRPILSARFKYVFVDEYQDCSNAQRSLLANLFDGTDTVVQRIGDMDQAIYNSISSAVSSKWDTSGSCLEIAETNRYGEEIARVVSKLRTGQKAIISLRGHQNRKPVLLVYNEGAEKQVVRTFVEEIKKHNLNPHGVFKAIGMVAKSTGTTILDYWDSFADDILPRAKDGWVSYRQEVARQLAVGRLYKVTQIIEELLVLVARCHNMRTEDNGFYTKTRIRKLITKKIDDGFRGGILQLAVACASAPKQAEHNILLFLCSLCREIFGGAWTEDELNSTLSADSAPETRRQPLPLSCDDGITVSLSTIHGVKGETHDATLYLETEHYRSSDLRRIMPLFDGEKLNSGDIYEKSRRCAYVGLSRPRHLLCVAMKAKTYEGHEGAFEKDWKVIYVH